MEILEKNKALQDIKTFRVDLNQPMKNNFYREGVLINGEYGWAEFAPFPHHSVEHSSRWLQSALEMAWTKLPEPKLTKVKTNAIAVSDDLENVIEAVNKSGCKTLKIKLSGKNIDQEVSNLREISVNIQNIKFRIDFNGELTLDDAVSFSNKSEGLPIEYIEQPCKTLKEIKELKQKIKTPIGIDESFRLKKEILNEDFIHEILESCDYLIVKVIPIGGITRFLKLRDLLVPRFNRIVISGSMDTSVGLYLSTLAQSIMEPITRLAAGVVTGMLLKNDVTTSSVLPINGLVDVKRLSVDIENIVGSPNKNELIQKLNECFDFGRNNGWF
ncbi:MAG: enolase C-terminal domain-like protein [Candidatus Nanopelagicales bacterium]